MARIERWLRRLTLLHANVLWTNWRRKPKLTRWNSDWRIWKAVGCARSLKLQQKSLIGNPAQESKSPTSVLDWLAERRKAPMSRAALKSRLTRTKRRFWFDVFARLSSAAPF